jgi:imidazolonepropionase-like amidohydrolase
MKHAILACLLLFPSLLFASPPTLAPAVREFVTVDREVVALRHVRVIDGTGAAPREDQTLVVADGKIRAIGSAAETPLPDGAQVMDLAGDTVLPGLVGMHDHIYYPAPGAGDPRLYPEHAFSFPRLYLAGGVTTIRTTGSVEPYTDLELKKAIDAGRMVGPKIHVTGPYLEGAGAFTPQMHELTGPEDARAMVNYWADEGATSFKAYMHITRAELAAAIEAAHARGLKVTGHLCSIGFREAAALGIDDLEHGLMVDSELVPDKKPDECPAQKDGIRSLLAAEVSGPELQQTIRTLVEKGVAVTSTLPVFETLVPNRPPLRDVVLQVMTPEARISYLERRARIGQQQDSPWPALLKKEMEFERAFAAAGGRLVTGLDPTGYGGVVAGFGSQRAVELLVEAGFTPVEAIRIATANGAELLGEADRIGTLAAGKQADVVVVKGDPSADIATLENVVVVFKDGIGFDPEKLVDSVRGSVGLR